MGERYVRNVQVGGSIPLCSIEIIVLGGELAVPCNPESAIPGPNSHRRFGDPGCSSGPKRNPRKRGLTDQIPRNGRPPNPVRTGR